MKVSELIKKLRKLTKEHGEDLDVALVYEVQGFFAFDMYADADIFQYPVNDDGGPLEDQVTHTVMAITNVSLDEEEPERPSLRIVKSDEH